MSRFVTFVAKRCVLEQNCKSYYWQPIESRIMRNRLVPTTNMTDFDFCLEVVSRSHQPLRYIWRWISRKPFEILEHWVPKDHQQEMAYGLSNCHVTGDVTWPHRCCKAVPSAILATAWLLVNNWCSFVTLSSHVYMRSYTTRAWTLTRRLVSGYLVQVQQIGYETELISDRFSDDGRWVFATE